MSSTDQSPGGSHKWVETTLRWVSPGWIQSTDDTSLLMRANQAPALLFSDGCFFLREPIPCLEQAWREGEYSVASSTSQRQWSSQISLNHTGPCPLEEGPTVCREFLFPVLSWCAVLWFLTMNPKTLLPRMECLLLRVCLIYTLCAHSGNRGLPATPSLRALHALCMLHPVALQVYLSNIHSCHSFHH